jgi:hypothetical protein
MSQAMLKIKPDVGSCPKTTPNLLPCRVHYDGPVDPAQSYWSPTQNKGKLQCLRLQAQELLPYFDLDSMKTAYFRGRKLHGKTVKLPEGYRGVVVEKQATPAASPQHGQEVVDLEQEDAAQQEPLGSLETKAEFEELVIWGHEATADAGSDPYLRIEEWTRLAEQVRAAS